MLRKYTATLAALLLALLVATPGALAEPAPAKPAADEPKLFDFEGDTIETEFLKPDTGMIGGLVRKDRRSLITIRTDFIDEIVRSAEDI